MLPQQTHHAETRKVGFLLFQNSNWYRLAPEKFLLLRPLTFCNPPILKAGDHVTGQQAVNGLKLNSGAQRARQGHQENRNFHSESRPALDTSILVLQ